MQRDIPLLPFWLSLVLIIVSIALPTSSLQAASKKYALKYAVHTSKVSKTVAHKKSKRSSKKSRKHTSCNRVMGKKQALTFINSNGQLSRLAGITPDEEIPTKATNDGSSAEVSSQMKLVNYAETADENLPDEGEDLAELEQEDNVTVDIEAFKTLYLSYIDGGNSSDNQEDLLACGIDKKKIMDGIMDWIGTNYHFGGSSRSGIDCSSFTRTIFATAGNFMLPRTAAEQYEVGQKIRGRDNMQFGDIVFFHTRRNVYVSHVGIYLGDNLFAHASSRYGVTVSSLESEYYDKRLIGVRRLQHNDVVRYALNQDNNEHSRTTE